MIGWQSLHQRAQYLWRWVLCFSFSLLVACQQIPTTPGADTVDNEGTNTELVGTEAAKQDETCDCGTAIEKHMQALPPPLLSCPAPKSGKKAPVVAATKKKAPEPVDDKLIVGYVERVELVPDNISLKARIDTGAGLSSINGLDITDFERDGERWIRFALLDPDTSEKIYLERPVRRYKMIKQLSGPSQRRPVVSLSVVLGPIEEQVETTVTDRSGYLYQVLIGRNFLRDRVIVDVSRKFTAKLYKK